MGGGSRASTSFLERGSAGIGPAKAEAAARKRLVSYQRLKRIVITPLTKSQEGGKDTNKLHCDGENVEYPRS